MSEIIRVERDHAVVDVTAVDMSRERRPIATAGVTLTTPRMMDTADIQELVAQAQDIADDVLFPRALEADAAGTVPEYQLQCIADGGFYGISTYLRPTATIAKVIEAFASGCLTTTFVYTQHLGAAAAAHTSDGPVRIELAADLAGGKKRGGVAFAHMLRPGTPMTTTEPVDGGWVMNGSAPWVTGWGHIDVVHAAARHERRHRVGADRCHRLGDAPQ